MNSIGQNIKAARRAAGITQQKLADMTNFSRSYIGSIEIDGSVPSIEALQIIAEALNVPSGSLIPDKNINYLTKEEEEYLIKAYRALNVDKRRILLSMLAFLNSPQFAIGNTFTRSQPENAFMTTNGGRINKPK